LVDLGQATHYSEVDFADAFILASARAAAEIPLAKFDAVLSQLDGARRVGVDR